MGGSSWVQNSSARSFGSGLRAWKSFKPKLPWKKKGGRKDIIGHMRRHAEQHSVHRYDGVILAPSGYTE